MDKHWFMMTAAAALMGGVLVFGMSDASAASGSERDCDAVGGTYVKDGPNSICIEPETTKDVKGKALGTATQNTTTGHGNTGNKTQEECSGNQGQCKQQ